MWGENWEKVPENRKWKNRDGWRFLYNSLPYLWKRLKNEDDDSFTDTNTSMSRFDFLFEHVFLIQKILRYFDINFFTKYLETIYYFTPLLKTRHYTLALKVQLYRNTNTLFFNWDLIFKYKSTIYQMLFYREDKYIIMYVVKLNRFYLENIFINRFKY